MLSNQKTIKIPTPELPKSTKRKLKPMPPLRPFGGSLQPFGGTWTEEKARHLLSRTIFGPTRSQIQQVVDQGLEVTLNQLFAIVDAPEPPVNYDFQRDPEVPIGSTWVNAGYPNEINVDGYRVRSFVGWLMEINMKPSISILEKMVLFWHNHFVVADINDTRFFYKNNATLREHALGNFKTLTALMTLDPAMLRYLNGNQNTAGAPNENYARELLELFTVGKGELAGPGDYSTFTEVDVIEMAKVLTGWRDYGFNNTTAFTPNIGAYFTSGRHDKTRKTLSHRFGNISIGNEDDKEYLTLINIIFEQEATSKFICRKLYRWFVYSDITDDIETDIITPMSQILRDNNFEIASVVRALISSEHFFSNDAVGCIIKSPIEFLLGLLRQFNISSATLPLAKKYDFNIQIYNFTAILQMQYYNHPSVAGWKAYYQMPLYYQSWINSVTLPLRTFFTDIFSYVGVEIGNKNMIIDVLGHVASLSDPYDINVIIEETAKFLYPQSLTAKQLTDLKSVVIPGLPDFEWTVEYSNYISNPNDADIKKSVESKLKVLMVVMLRMPEYHLS